MSTYKFAFSNTSAEWLKQLGVAALYALLLYVGEFFFESEAVVGHFEPACGLALAALLIGGKRYVWGVLCGAFLVHAITDDSLWRTAAIASSDALEAFIGAWLLTRGGKFDVRLPSLLDYLRLILLGGGGQHRYQRPVRERAIVVFRNAHPRELFAEPVPMVDERYAGGHSGYPIDPGLVAG